MRPIEQSNDFSKDLYNLRRMHKRIRAAIAAGDSKIPMKHLETAAAACEFIETVLYMSQHNLDKSTLILDQLADLTKRTVNSFHENPDQFIEQGVNKLVGALFNKK